MMHSSTANLLALWLCLLAVQAQEVTPVLSINGEGLLTAPQQQQQQLVHTAAAISSSGSDTTEAAQAPVLEKMFKDNLIKHNRYRANHGAPALQWDAELARTAAGWAAGCDFKHPAGVGYGQNLHASGGDIANNHAGTLIRAIDQWYAEIKDYRWDDSWTNNFARNTGHFTQVVWKSTARMGCAVLTCTPLYVKGAPFGSATMPADYVVCNYLPAGNVGVQSAFDSNVLRAGTPVEDPTAHILEEGKSLASGKCLTSQNQAVRLCVAATGELIASKGAGRSASNILWRNRLRGPTEKAPYRLMFLGTSRKLLVVRDKDNTALARLLSIQADGVSGQLKLVLRDDGTLAVQAGDNCISVYNGGRRAAC